MHRLMGQPRPRAMSAESRHVYDDLERRWPPQLEGDRCRSCVCTTSPCRWTATRPVPIRGPTNPSVRVDAHCTSGPSPPGPSAPCTDLKLRVHTPALSLDGYAAGPNQGPDQPIGEGGRALHEWAFATRSFRHMHGLDGGAGGIDDRFA